MKSVAFHEMWVNMQVNNVFNGKVTTCPKYTTLNGHKLTMSFFCLDR